MCLEGIRPIIVGKKMEKSIDISYIKTRDIKKTRVTE